MNHALFISCPKGIEYLLAEELRLLGLVISEITPQGVYGEASLATLYQICIWTRLANRVQLILCTGQAHDEQKIYQLAHQFPWQTVFSHEKTFAISFHGLSAKIKNAMYGAQLVKDGIVDHFRQLKGTRPSINKTQPDLRLHAYLKNDMLTLSLDLCGYSLHQRGYRKEQGEAPLKENLAAALLLRAKWPEYAEKGYALHDPFCGVGTLVIEAALMAGNIAPGLFRQDQSLVHWVQHQQSLWEKLRQQALQALKPIKNKLIGTDLHPAVITKAKQNAERAGLANFLHFSLKPLSTCRSEEPLGLAVMNPPYGERLSEATQLLPLYQQIGEVFSSHFKDWEMAVFTADPLLAKAIGLRSHKQYPLWNGPIACKLYCFSLNEQNRFKGLQSEKRSESTQILINRLEKKSKQLKKWKEKNQITCYRIYDADLPEYNFAVDIYNDYAVLQEYLAPTSIPQHKAEQRSLTFIQALPLALGIDSEKLIVKQRKHHKGLEQYQKLQSIHKSMTVREGRAKFKVNLYDYLDTGLFLDLRKLRLIFGELQAGSRFLNCFCYTATASVHAALAGALTTNIDLSKTYLAWAEDNFKLNQLNPYKHQFLSVDALKWLKSSKESFDVIFLNPPSFSNSKRMEGILDIQRDHLGLIQAALRLLKTTGSLYFVTHLKSFQLDEKLKAQYSIHDLSVSIKDLDFKNSRTPRCFLFKKLDNAG